MKPSASMRRANPPSFEACSGSAITPNMIASSANLVERYRDLGLINLVEMYR
jgi:hypothetical protein